MQRRLRSSVMTSHMCRRDKGSIPELGSSRNTTAGAPTRAMASESFRLLPPEYEPQTRSAYGVSETWSTSSWASDGMAASSTDLSRANIVRVSRAVISSSKGSNCGQ